MFRAKNATVIFVGNSNGYIQVFETQTERQMKSLYDSQLAQNKVLCIDITENGAYLLAGYQSGALVLWDAVKFKRAHIMNDIVKDKSSEFSMVKILFVSD